MSKVVELPNNMGMGGTESLVKDYAQYTKKDKKGKTSNGDKVTQSG